MATVKATCPTCGDVDLTTDDVQVRVCDDDHSASYNFRCPECSLMVAKDTEQRIVDLLVSGGCRMNVWHLPKELSEPHCNMPTFTTDDYFDLHELLQRDDCFELLTVRPEDRK